MNIHCKYDSLVEVNSLKPHPKNRNKHPAEQIDRLAKILKYQGVRAPIVVSNRSGKMVKGHGTLQAIKKNGWKEAPVVFQDFESEDQEWLFVQSDNAIAMWAQLDLKGINADIPELGPFDLDLIGIKNFTENFTDKANNPDFYTSKIEPPIYTPKGENPSPESLCDIDKYLELIKQIEITDMPDNVSEFLKLAATRHIVFQYDKIAEFYAHASPPIKDLMENSALIIIDYKKALENGFVEMSKNLAKAFKNDSI